MAVRFTRGLSGMTAERDKDGACNDGGDPSIGSSSCQQWAADYRASVYIETRDSSVRDT